MIRQNLSTGYVTFLNSANTRKHHSSKDQMTRSRVYLYQYSLFKKHLDEMHPSEFYFKKTFYQFRGKNNRLHLRTKIQFQVKGEDDRAIKELLNSFIEGQPGISVEQFQISNLTATPKKNP